MHKCIVKSCKSVFIERVNDDRRNDKNVTFHFIPKDPIKRKKWLEALGLQNTNDRARICSNHFHEDAFDRISTNCIGLREHATPNFCVENNKNNANNCGTETNTLSQDDSQDLSNYEGVEGIATHTISDDEMNCSEKAQVESPVEITQTLINSVSDISSKCKSNVSFYFGDGDVPGLAPFVPKPKPEKPPSAQPYKFIYSSCNSQSITCSPRRKPIENEPETPPCETCGTKKKRSMDRATSVSPERIFYCPDKKQIREQYEKEIKRYKQKMRGMQQKMRRLEASRNRYKLSSNIE